MADGHISRRGFVGTAGAAVGAASAFAAPAVGRAGTVAERKRLGIIGAGSRGNQLLDTFLKEQDVDVVAVADVDDHHAGATAERIQKEKGGERPDASRDYRAMLDRKDLDGVIIATPDHWHALPTIHAVLAGKDVYVEKPVAHNVAEGRAMIEAAKKTGKIIAVGTQQRSSNHFRKAVETVQSGRLGKVFWIQTWNYENISPEGLGRYPDQPTPSHVDYDRWLGPAPSRPFNLNRFHLLFRWYFDYAGGMMSDWGVHLNDIVLWALNSKGPQSVYATGGVVTSDDDRDTPDTLQVVYEFPEDVTLTYSMRKGNGLKFNGKDYGILFCGTDGSLMLNRSGFEIIPDQLTVPYGIKLVHGDRKLRTIDLEPSQEKGDDGQTPHVRNFLDCMVSREKPTSDIEIGHHSTNTCHLGNIAYQVGRKLYWDAEAERFKDDPEADALLSRNPRQGYELPAI